MGGGHHQDLQRDRSSSESHSAGDPCRLALAAVLPRTKWCAYLALHHSILGHLHVRAVRRHSEKMECRSKLLQEGVGSVEGKWARKNNTSSFSVRFIVPFRR